MVDRLRRLLLGPGTSVADRDTGRALNQMRRDVKQGRKNELPLADLRPVLIPSPILAHGKWVGPYHYFPELPVSLTWAYLRPHGTLLYLSQNVAESLDQHAADWRRKAREALTRDFGLKPWTHVFPGASGAPEAVALMHDDGLGPSRLLCAHELGAQFPGGFTLLRARAVLRPGVGRHCIGRS